MIDPKHSIKNTARELLTKQTEQDATLILFLWITMLLCVLIGFVLGLLV